MRRMPEMDALRGLAALSILVYHLRPAAYDLGWPRVDLFLVLTGFLVTGLVRKYGATPGFYARFWARRGLRLLPTYYLLLLAMVAVNPFLARPCDLGGLPYYLALGQNLPLAWSGVPPAFNMYCAHTWTLALDAQFVLVWVPLVRVLGRAGTLRLATVLVVLAPLVRCAGAHPWLLAARCDGYALGAMLALAVEDRAWVERHADALRRVVPALAALGLAGVIVGAAVLGRPNYSAPMAAGPALQVSVACLFYAALVALVWTQSGRPALGVLRLRPLLYLGRISYGLYLYHPVVFIALFLAARRLGLPQTHALEALMLAATGVVAAVSWHALERPVLALRDCVPFVVPPCPAPAPDPTLRRLSGAARRVGSASAGLRA